MKPVVRIFSLLLAFLLLMSFLIPFAHGEEVGLTLPETEKIIYGYSGEDRELVAYRYGSGANVLIMGFAIHGFEDNFDRDGQCLVNCAYTVMTHLSGSYLVDGCDWTVYILPCMNPDGLASGHTNFGPGRCTTTYLRADGTLSSARGIDLNRCFPTGFYPMSNERNYTTSRPMAAREALALDAFLQSVKGTGKNVLIDVHGWLQKAITSHQWLMEIFTGEFSDLEADYRENRPGYLIAHAQTLGYDSLLMELPRNIRSMDDYNASDIEPSMLRCVDALLLAGSPRCGGEHTLEEIALAPTCTQPGYAGTGCTLCGYRQAGDIPATGHIPAEETVIRTDPTATRPGSEAIPCAVCGAVARETILPACFTDVSAAAYYADALDYCFDAGIVAGTTDTTFSPAKTCTRGQIVTFLWRTMGCPEPALTENPFLDVPETAYCYRAILWAYDSGITYGVDETHFAPNAECTRAQIVSFLWRTVGTPQASAQELPFTDVNPDSFYYLATLWACENGITAGVSPNTFAPGRKCTRAEAVCFLYRTILLLSGEI